MKELKNVLEAIKAVKEGSLILADEAASYFGSLCFQFWMLQVISYLLAKIPDQSIETEQLVKQVQAELDNACASITNLCGAGRPPKPVSEDPKNP